MKPLLIYSDKIYDIILVNSVPDRRIMEKFTCHIIIIDIRVTTCRLEILSQ